MSQCGQRASFNRDRNLADEPHRHRSVWSSKSDFDSLRGMETAASSVSPEAASLRFWYGASIEEFLATEPRAIVGDLSRHSGFAVLPTHTGAWLTEIDILQTE